MNKHYKPNYRNIATLIVALLGIAALNIITDTHITTATFMLALIIIIFIIAPCISILIIQIKNHK